MKIKIIADIIINLNHLKNLPADRQVCVPSLKPEFLYTTLKVSLQTPHPKKSIPAFLYPGATEEVLEQEGRLFLNSGPLQV